MQDAESQSIGARGAGRARLVRVLGFGRGDQALSNALVATQLRAARSGYPTTFVATLNPVAAQTLTVATLDPLPQPIALLSTMRREPTPTPTPPLVTMASAPQSPAPSEPPPVAIATLTTSPALPAMRPRAPAALPSLVAFAPATRLPPAVQPEAHREMPPPLMTTASAPQTPAPVEPPPVAIATLTTQPALPAMRPRAPAALPSLVAYAPATLLPPAVQPEAHPEMLPPLVRFASRERRGSSRASESRPILIASLATPTSLPPLVAPLPGPRRFFPRRAELPTVARRALAPGAMIASFQRPRRAQRSAAPSQAPPLNNAMAVGFAPQWTLKMRDGLIMFSSADGTNFNARSPAPFESAGVRSYAATSEGRLLHVAVYERPCADAASGQTLATTVIVRLDGKTFNGCGAAGVSPQQ